MGVPATIVTRRTFYLCVYSIVYRYNCVVYTTIFEAQGTDLNVVFILEYKINVQKPVKIAATKYTPMFCIRI